MMAGKYRDRCRFYRPLDNPDPNDDSGLVTVGYEAEPFYKTPGQLQEQRGRERIEGGQTTSIVAGTLKIPSGIVARSIVPEADKVAIRDFDGNWIEYQIRSLANHDRRGRELEFVVERGVAI